MIATNKRIRETERSMLCLLQHELEKVRFARVFNELAYQRQEVVRREAAKGIRGLFVAKGCKEPVWVSQHELGKHANRLLAPKTVIDAVSEYAPEYEHIVHFFPWEHTTPCAFICQILVYSDDDGAERLTHHRGREIYSDSKGKLKWLHQPSRARRGLLISEDKGDHEVVLRNPEVPLSEEELYWEIVRILKLRKRRWTEGTGTCGQAR